MHGLRVLIVEDEAALATAIGTHLASAGLGFAVAASIAEADTLLRQGDLAAVILDLRLLDGDGLSLLRGLRRRSDPTPVLVASANADLAMRVRVLEAGADDYLVKPFAAQELLARIRALLRRPRRMAPTVLKAGAMELDTATAALRVAGLSAPLGRREAQALAVLMRRAGTLVPREVLEGVLYGPDEAVTPNATEAVVSRLRKRLESLPSGVTLLAMRGLGYVLSERPETLP